VYLATETPRFTFNRISDILYNMNSKEFTNKINDIVKEKKPITYIDAIVHYCESQNIEVETTSRLISKSLKEKIKAEAINANMLKIKKGGTLPV
tara:strand:+ start:5967 stop:6248 length:282 start_codon:yes stop_codon:yes gene_type:complete